MGEKKSLFLMGMSKKSLSLHGILMSRSINIALGNSDENFMIQEDLSCIFQRKFYRKIFKGKYLSLSSWYFFLFLIRALPLIRQLRHRDTLVQLKINNQECGKNLYDFLLIKLKKGTLNKVPLRVMMYALVAIVVARCQAHNIHRLKVKYLYLQDNVYRYGLCVDILKSYCDDIVIVSPVGVNVFYTGCFPIRRHGNFPVRYIDERQFRETVGKISDQAIDKYLDDRFSGKLPDHDTRRAYSTDAVKNDEMTRVNKFTVVIACHVLCDAPNSFLNFYHDYMEWLENTLKILGQNENIHVWIKPHPSRTLYGEGTEVEELVQKYNFQNCELIYDNLFPIRSHFDCVITCGGTIGMEAASWGKIVLLGGFAPYRDIFINNTVKSKSDYERALFSINKLSKPSLSNVLDAKLALIFNKKMTQWSNTDLNITTESLYRGDSFDEEALIQNLIKENLRSNLTRSEIIKQNMDDILALSDSHFHFVNQDFK